jgi:hypothetical protein
MRLSVDAKSPFYFGAALTNLGLCPHSVRITLDGVTQTMVTEASEEEGWADVIDLDASQQPFMDDAGNIAIRRLHGLVKISADPPTVPDLYAVAP